MAEMGGASILAAAVKEMVPEPESESSLESNLYFLLQRMPQGTRFEMVATRCYFESISVFT